MQKFEETLNTLRDVGKELRDRGIVLEHLDEAIEQLNRHHENIIKIENNIEAIQEEVIQPVKAELEFNKVSGKFSILGFWIGIASLLVSLITIATTGISNFRSNQKIENVVTKGGRAPGQFSCEIIEEIPTTVVSHPTRGNIKFISWKSEYFSSIGDSPEIRCIEASNAFQIAQEQGILVHLITSRKDGENFICASKSKDKCDRKLFRLVPNQDPNQILQELMTINISSLQNPLVQ